jgi:flagellar hook-basal body complex protein FliE
MPVPPIDPSFATTGPEWSVGSAAPTQAPSEGSFGGMLSNAISSLDQSQTQGAAAAQSLATGTATDPTSVVMQVEQASLAMQLASQVRTKAVDAENDIFHTQV